MNPFRKPTDKEKMYIEHIIAPKICGFLGIVCLTLILYFTFRAAFHKPPNPCETKIFLDGAL